MSATPSSRWDAAVMGVWGVLAGFLVHYAAFFVRLNRVSEGADAPAWYWAFMLNVAALLVGAAWCLLRRQRYRSLGLGLLAGFALPYVVFLIGALQ
jgi:hypothetical protein